MSLVKLIAPEDEGTLTASSAATGTPVTNLWTYHPKDIWMSAAGAAHTITIDRGAATPIDTIALLYTNMEVGRTFRIRGATSQAGLASAPYSQTITFSDFFNSDNIPLRHLYHVLPAGLTYRWWDIQLNTSGIASYAGRLIMGLAWETRAQWGLNRDPGQSFVRTTTHGGADRKSVRRGKPAITFKMLHETKESLEQGVMWLEELSKDVLIAYDAQGDTLQNRLYYGTLEGKPYSDEQFQVHSHNVEVREYISKRG